MQELNLNLNELTSALDAIIWVAEPFSNRLQYISSYVEQLLGYTPIEYLHQPELWINRVHPADRERLTEFYESAVLTSRHFELSYRAICQDGRIVWLHDSVRVGYEKDAPALLYGTSVDVTEQGNAQNALQLLTDIVSLARSCTEVEEVLKVALRSTCIARGWPMGLAWMMDNPEERLVCASTFIGHGDFALRCEARAAQTFGVGEDTPGQVWQSLSPIWFSELPALEENNQTAERLYSSFVFPIKDGDRLFGILEFFCQDRTAPDRSLLDCVERLGSQLSTILHDRITQTALEEQKEESQVILDSVPAMVWYKDRYNNIVRANWAAAQSVGLNVAEIQGRSTFELYPGEAEKYYLDDLQVVESGQPKLGIVEPLVLKSGERRWVRTDKMPFRRADGTINGVIVFAVDITEQKEKQTELQLEKEELSWAVEESTRTLEHAQSKLETLSRQVPGIIYQFAVHPGGEQEIVYVSESCRQILAYEPSELEGDLRANALKIFHPDDIPQLEQAIIESIQNFSLFRFEGRVYTKSGLLRWIQASSTPERHPEGSLFWNGILTDITDLKEAQQKVKELNQDLEQRVAVLAAVNRELELLTHKLEAAYDQATEASRLKSEFVANISHEVRTPISAVIGLSDQIMQTDLNEEQQELMRILRDSAESLLTIINDILDFSKMEAGQIDFQLSDLSPLTLVEGCADLLASNAREKKLSLMTYVEPGIPEFVQGDPVRLRQVLLNLASNAVKFTEAGDVIIKTVLLDPNKERSWLRFEVTDSGIGLSEGARRRLFQPFVQADGSTSRKYGGTGLGLSISKRLVELMEGEIGVESSLGKGSTFWFTIPLRFTEDQDLLHIEQPRARTRARLLIVDSSASGASIVSNYLRAAGFHTDTAIDTRKGLSMMLAAAEAGYPYQIVLAAIENIDKDPLVESILKLSMPLAPALVLITNLEEREVLLNALQCGFRAGLVKPFRRGQLIDTVNNILKQPASAPAAALGGSREAVRLPQQLEEKKAQLSSSYPILVAEDNLVMQQLAIRQIRKLGLKAEAVSNGREVLEAIKHTHYGLILMDCQMPEMDGFEATTAIREYEQGTGKHVPIIAMTASAMKGDSEHCLNTGMDDYLSKPVSQSQLSAVLKRWLQAPIEEERETAVKNQPSAQAENSPIDIARLQKLYGAEDCHELLHSFEVESKELTASLEQLLARENSVGVAMEAHQLKGLAAVMTADRLAGFCLQLEQAAREYNWTAAGQYFATAKIELDKILAYIKEVLRMQPLDSKEQPDS